MDATAGGQTIAIIGGGISGLSAAWELCTTAPDTTRIVVLEASDRVGGLLRSVAIGGRQIDVGADAFLARRPEAKQLCDELGISPDLVPPQSGHASVWARGSLRALPDGLVLGVPTRLGPLARSGIVSATALVRASLDLVLPAARQVVDDMSVGEIVSRRLGREVKDLVAGPLVGGINAGRVDELSAEAVFPALLDAYRNGGSLMRELRSDTSAPAGGGPGAVTAGAGGAPAPVFLTPSSGMASIPAALRDALEARGVAIATSEEVRGLVRSGEEWGLQTSRRDLDVEGVIVATPARVAARLVSDVDVELARLLGSLHTASVVVVTFRFDRSSIDAPLEGTGFLVPAVDATLVTASTFLTTKWPHMSRDGDVLLRASAGRSGDDRTSEMSDEQIVSTVLSELGDMLGGLGDPAEVVVSRFDESFPQYLVGHIGWAGDVHERTASHHGLALAGSSYLGIGVPACIASGRRAARIVADELGVVPMQGTVRAVNSESSESSQTSETRA